MTKITEFRDVTRITVVDEHGRAFERYNIYPDGCELHLQDDGRTLKVFPLSEKRPVDGETRRNPWFWPLVAFVGLVAIVGLGSVVAVVLT